MSTVPEALPRSVKASTWCEAFQITAAERLDAVALRTPGGRAGDGLPSSSAAVLAHDPTVCDALHAFR